MPAFDRAELDEMVRRWLEANKFAEENKDWTRISSFYTADANYGWAIGPDEEFMAVGRDEIERYVLGLEMVGFDEDSWTYPYVKVIVDDAIGEVVGFWRQIAGTKRPDGSLYEVAGLGGSWFRYGGNYQWNWQRDFFDLGNMRTLFGEMAAAGALSPGILKRVEEGLTADGEEAVLQPGHFRRGEGPIGQYE